MRFCKFVKDFIFLSFKFGIIEGWQDAKFINDEEIQEQLRFYEEE